jgi:hypothetical protein
MGLNYLHDPWLPANYHDTFFNFIILKFEYIVPLETGYFSSYWLNIFIAKILNDWFFKDGLFDLRSLAFVSTLMLFSALAFTVFALRKYDFLLKLAAVLGMIIIFTDISFVQYFNSFYTELGTVIYTLFFFSFFLIYVSVEKETNHKFQTNCILKKVVLVVLVIFSGFMASTSKTQDIGMLLPVSFLISILLYDIFIKIKQKTKNYFKLTSYVIVSFFVMVIFLSFSVTLGAKKPDTTKYSLYNVIFQEIAPSTPNPEQNLREVGFSEDDAKLFSIYSGTDAYQQNTGYNNPRVQSYLINKISYKDVLKYYARHPITFLKMTEFRSDSLFINSVHKPGDSMMDKTIPPIKGNHEKWVTNGVPTISTSFSCWSSLKMTFFPKSIYFITIVLFLSCGLSIYFIIKYKEKSIIRLFLNIHIVNISVIMMALIQFATCMLGDSRRDDVKHFFMFNILFDFTLIFLLCYIVKLCKLIFIRTFPIGRSFGKESN